MTTVLGSTARPATVSTTERQARHHRLTPARAVSPRVGMSRLAALPLGSVVEVTGGVLVSARVQAVRHEPRGSQATLVGRCPERLGAASGSVLAARSCPGPLQDVVLRWDGDGATTTTRLPVEVAQGDVVVLFSPRFQGEAARRRALAEPQGVDQQVVPRGTPAR